MFENIGLESSSGEQQSKRTQSGSSSQSGCDREQQLKQTQAASMQQLKRAQSGSSSWNPEVGAKREAADEADAIGPGSSS